MDTLPSKRIEYLPNNEAYNRWAATYDSDGNILQALDSHALQESLLPRFLECLTSRAQPGECQTFSIIDLGCGTGRADILLLAALQHPNVSFLQVLSSCGYQELLLSGLDASVGMLKIATSRVPASTCIGTSLAVQVQYGEYDIRTPNHGVGWIDCSRDAMLHTPADAMISTLVLEHLELNVFFKEASKLVRLGGHLLLTNMHPDMGNTPVNSLLPEVMQGQGSAITGAGFNDALHNVKIRVATDYSHAIDDVVQAAAREGFVVVNDHIEELAVEDWMLETNRSGEHEAIMGPRGYKWRGIKCWFGLILQRR